MTANYDETTTTKTYDERKFEAESLVYKFRSEVERYNSLWYEIMEERESLAKTRSESIIKAKQERIERQEANRKISIANADILYDEIVRRLTGNKNASA